MRTKRIAACALVLALGLTAGLLAARAHAAGSIQALRDLGYTVQAANIRAGCTTWVIQGFGNSLYADNCDPGFQSTLDSLAKPTSFCNTKWQFQHPEQLDAVSQIRRKGWGVTGEQCADVYEVTNPATPYVRLYSGPAAGLAALVATLQQAPGAPADPADQSWWCLPLCATPVRPTLPPQPVTVTVAGPAPPPEVRVEVRTETVREPAPPPVVQTETVTRTVTAPAPTAAPKKQPVKKAPAKVKRQKVARTRR